MEDVKVKLYKEMPYKWRVQSFSKYKPQGQCVAYIDARDVMNRLDEVFGIEGWQDDYKVIDDKLFAGIGVFHNGAWVWKWDTGVESLHEKEKGQVSDAFKRAAVKFGIGRFLYNLKIQYVDANEVKTQTNFPYPIDKSGKRIWDITAHINNIMKVAQKPFEFLKKMSEFKKDLGEEEYYKILGTHGYSHANEIKPENCEAALKVFAKKVQILKTEGGR